MQTFRYGSEGCLALGLKPHFFFFFLIALVACGSSQAMDRTHVTAVPRVTFFFFLTTFYPT